MPMNPSMPWLTPTPPLLLAGSWLLIMIFGLHALACNPGGLEPAEYPDTKVNSASFAIELKDPRNKLEDPITPPTSMYKNDEASAPRALPPGFKSQAQQRLNRLASGKGLALKVQLDVRRADVTFFNDYRGDFTRFDVELGIRITTDKDVLLMKGNGGTWRQLPSSEASLEEQRRVFEFTALDAFDQYFASEQTLSKLNKQVAAYYEQHPEAR